MARIIMKSPYLKPGTAGGKHAGNYAKYIATREGVELAEDTLKHLPATVKQEQLIRQILRDFPDSTDFHEYGDYKQNPTRENATEFISRVLETHSGELGDREKYVSYIAERPGVEKLGKHGLFTDAGKPVVIAQVMKEMADSKSCTCSKRPSICCLLSAVISTAGRIRAMPQPAVFQTECCGRF